MTRRIGAYPGAYKGSYWAIVLGHKDSEVIPAVLHSFVETKWKRVYLEQERAKHPGAKIRAIRQPNPPFYEPGM